MSKEEKIFRLSVMSDLGDSVVQTGSGVRALKTEYFSHYTKAIEYLREQCREFVRGEYKMTTEREMFERSFERPKNFFKLPSREQWAIDKRLGLLDWRGNGLSEEDRERFKKYYGLV